MDRGAWWATVPGVAQSRTQLKQLSTHMHTVAHYVLHFYVPCSLYFWISLVVQWERIRLQMQEMTV